MWVGIIRYGGCCWGPLVKPYLKNMEIRSYLPFIVHAIRFVRFDREETQNSDKGNNNGEYFKAYIYAFHWVVIVCKNDEACLL